MDLVLVRYGEIGTKSDRVRSHMAQILRQRVVDRLEYDEIDFEKVSLDRGRIIVRAEDTNEVKKSMSDLPGVKSISPALVTDAELNSIENRLDELQIGETFGVRTNRAGEHPFDSRKVNRRIGSFIEELTGSNVDLDNPDTWIDIDIRFEKAYIFTERIKGPGGFPVGSEDQLATLISGGIDSPVAAYQLMCRGADILPIYFYNKPIAAEDHFIRFKSVLKQLKKFHPGKKWHYYVVDMEDVNKELMKVGKGRMVLHRKIMFVIAEMIADKEGLDGIVTGESLGQKSSQTPSNLANTSAKTDLPIHRPLLAWNKNNISEKAREIGTFELAEVNSACRSLAPESPATEMKDSDLERIEKEVDISQLIQKGFESAEKRSDL